MSKRRPVFTDSFTIFFSNAVKTKKLARNFNLRDFSRGAVDIIHM